MTGEQPRFTEGPARYFRPVWSRNSTGWTFGGPSGYVEVDGPEYERLILEYDEPEQKADHPMDEQANDRVRYLAERIVRRRAANREDAREIESLSRGHDATPEGKCVRHLTEPLTVGPGDPNKP